MYVYGICHNLYVQKVYFIEDWKGIYSVYGIICILFINMNFNSNPKIRNRFIITLYWNVKLMVKDVYIQEILTYLKKDLLSILADFQRKKTFKCYSDPPDFGLDTIFAKLSQSPTCLSCTVLWAVLYKLASLPPPSNKKCGSR